MEIGWTPYPWHALEKVPRKMVRALRDVFDLLEDPALAHGFGRAAGASLGDENLRLVTRRTRMAAGTVPVFRDGAVCLFTNQQRSLQVLVEVEPELAYRVATTLLSRPPLWVDRAQPTPPLLHAAFGAFLIANVRATTPDHGLSLAAVGTQARQAFLASATTVGPVVDLAVVFDDATYGASVWWQTSAQPTRGNRAFGSEALRSMGSVPLGLHVVAAVAQSTRAELGTLEVGDAWMPGAGWRTRLDDGALVGDVLLLPAVGTRGPAGQLSADGGIVLRGSGMQPQEQSEQQGTPDPGASGPRSGSTSEALADVPVEVRVEVGTVTLRAREWAAVQPGDVLTTGHRIAERVVLRVGGVAVASGELVDVEGELGVRIHEVFGPEHGGA